MTGLAVFCSDKIDFRSRQEQSCPTTANETTPYPHPHLRKLMCVLLCLTHFSIFVRYNYSIWFLNGCIVYIPRCLQSIWQSITYYTRLTALCPGLPGWAGTRKVKPIWILLKQETVSGSDISWAICKSASRSVQRTTPATHHSVFYRPDALSDAQPTASKHWRH